MRAQRNWIIIPLTSIGLLVFIVLATRYFLVRPRGPQAGTNSDASDSSHAIPERKRGEILTEIDKLPIDSTDRALLHPIAQEILSITLTGSDNDDVALQDYERRLSELQLKVEKLDDEISSPDARDLVDRLKEEVQGKREDAWKLRVSLVNRKIDVLPQANNVMDETAIIEKSIGQLDSAARDSGNDKAANLQNQLKKLTSRLRGYQPTVRQVVTMISNANNRYLMLALAGVSVALALSLLTVVFAVRAIRDTKSRPLQDISLKNDFYALKNSFQQEVSRIDTVEGELRKIFGLIKAQGVDKRRQQNDPEINQWSPQDDLTQPFNPSASARPPSLPPAAPSGFLGRISELQPFIPSPNKLMQYDPVSGLLLEGIPAPGPKYRVFRDPATQGLCVLPTVERAAMRQELYAVEQVFELDGPGSGAVTLVQHPQLEASESGYRLVTRGRLRVG